MLRSFLMAMNRNGIQRSLLYVVGTRKPDREFVSKVIRGWRNPLAQGEGSVGCCPHQIDPTGTAGCRNTRVMIQLSLLSRGLLEKLIAAQVVGEVPAFCDTREFVTVFMVSSRCFIPRARYQLCRIVATNFLSPLCTSLLPYPSHHLNRWNGYTTVAVTHKILMYYLKHVWTTQLSDVNHIIFSAGLLRRGRAISRLVSHRLRRNCAGVANIVTLASPYHIIGSSGGCEECCKTSR